MSNVISWVQQALPFAAGFVGVQRLVDAGSGRAESRAFRLNAAGAVVQSLEADEVGPGMAERLSGLGIALQASYCHPLLAATASPHLRAHYAAFRDLLPGLAPRGVQSLTLHGPVLAVLEGSEMTPDGTRQRLHLVALDRPLGSATRAVDLSSLGLTAPRAITAMAELDGDLVLAVSDPLAGFDLFVLSGLATDPIVEPLVACGAHRHAVNAVVACMARDGSDLLIGTAALAEGSAPVGNWGPELLRLDAQMVWDLVIGQPRFSPDGLRFPASGREPGLDSARDGTGNGIGNAALRAIAVGEMRHRRLSVIAMQDRAGPVAPDRRRLGPSLADYIGPVRLFASLENSDWSAVPLALPESAGAVTCLAIGPSGILVGHEGLGADDLPVTLVPLQ